MHPCALAIFQHVSPETIVVGTVPFVHGFLGGDECDGVTRRNTSKRKTMINRKNGKSIRYELSELAKRTRCLV